MVRRLLLVVMAIGWATSFSLAWPEMFRSKSLKYVEIISNHMEQSVSNPDNLAKNFGVAKKMLDQERDKQKKDKGLICALEEFLTLDSLGRGGGSCSISFKNIVEKNSKSIKSSGRSLGEKSGRYIEKVLNATISMHARYCSHVYEDEIRAFFDLERQVLDESVWRLTDAIIKAEASSLPENSSPVQSLYTYETVSRLPDRKFKFEDGELVWKSLVFAEPDEISKKKSLLDHHFRDHMRRRLVVEYLVTRRLCLPCAKFVQNYGESLFEPAIFGLKKLRELNTEEPQFEVVDDKFYKPIAAYNFCVALVKSSDKQDDRLVGVTSRYLRELVLDKHIWRSPLKTVE